MARRSIVQRTPQCRDLDAEIVGGHYGIRPYTGDKRVLGNQFAWALDQGNKNVERTATDRNRLSFLEKKTLSWKEGKRAEHQMLRQIRCRRGRVIRTWTAPSCHGMMLV